jgi:superfamily II DNA or RNA helicase
MEVHKKKREVQNKALTIWKDSDFRCSLELATGTGKTYLGVVAACEFIKRNPQEVSLIAVRKIPHIEMWKEEIKTWGYEEQLKNITILCHASAYKETEYYDNIVIDEAHGIFGKEFSKTLQIPCKRIMLLSATFNKTQKEQLLSYNIPINFSYSLEQAEKDGVVEPAMRCTYEVKLTSSELENYHKVSRKLSNLLLKTDCVSIQQLEFLYRKSNNRKQLGIIYAIRSSMTKAAECAKAKMEFVEEFANKTIKKIIVLTSSIDFVEALYTKLLPIFTKDRIFKYHSGLTKKTNDTMLNSYYDTPNGIMLAVKSLDEGIDDDEIEIAIICSGDRSTKQKIQREGRVLRLGKKGKKPIIINLHSKDTFEYDNIISSYKGRKVKPIVVSNFNELLTLL